MIEPIAVGVLGATGVVGQQYLRLLADHPWFQLTYAAASHASTGQTLQEALQGRWRQKRPLPNLFKRLPLSSIDAVDQAASSCSLLFSAVSEAVACKWDPVYAEAGLAVISHAAAFRSVPDVPLIIPEINPDHLEILAVQRKRKGWDTGCLVAKPSCSLHSYLLPLWPLHKEFGLKEIIVTTFQAASGAGYPGIAAEKLVDNVIPYIEGEESKSESEPLKIFGQIQNGNIKPLSDLSIAAHCNRVAVTHGHLACVSARFAIAPTLEEIRAIWQKKIVTRSSILPSAPDHPLYYCQEEDRPQTRLDRERGAGMTVSVGRLRPCPVMDWRFVGLSHNAVRGAAGGGLLLAELLCSDQELFHPKKR